jgi:hypothetical protein
VDSEANEASLTINLAEDDGDGEGEQPEPPVDDGEEGDLEPVEVEVISNTTDDGLIDGVSYDTTPFSEDTQIFTQLAADPQELGSEAAFANLIGLYEVANPDGQINLDTDGDGMGDTLLNPDDPDYARAAIENRVDGFEILAGANGDPSFNTNTEEFGDVALSGGKFYAQFVIANGGSEGFEGFEGFIANEDAEDSVFNNAVEEFGDLVAYFAFVGANPDGVEHLQSQGEGIYGFEDLPGGGDMDFNDALFQLNFLAESGTELA